MESLKELNAICQKPNYKTSGNWMVRTFLRDAALPFTWILLHTRVTADQVTAGALAVGLAACWFLAHQGSAAFLTGALLLQFWYYLDHVDGQIARYRKTACITGRFFDFLMHHIIHTLVIFSLGVCFSGSFSLGEKGIVAAAAAAFLMSLFNFMHDIKSKAIIERLLQAESIHVRQDPKHIKTGDKKKAESGAKILFSVLHKMCEIHVMMNTLTVFALTDFFLLKGAGLAAPLFLFYAAAITLLTFTKITHFIRARKADEEFTALFEVKLPSQDSHDPA